MLTTQLIPLLFASVCASAHQVHQLKQPVVQTTSGKIHGIVESNVQQFLGIPYAKPPVKDLRWEPPQPLSPGARKTSINATQLPPSCPQNPIGLPIFNKDVPQFQIQGYNSSNATSEDCLTLNVWSPIAKPSGLYPVIVFLYGGHFTTGGNNVPYQIPAQWVERTQSHIVVSLNYRVNLLGFPNAPGLSEQNVGLLDQRAAIEWVSKNIAAFGGDSSRITLWGQSAGAASVDFYNFAYYDDPIVSSLIMNSGSSYTPAIIEDSTHSNFTYMASQLGCGNATISASEMIACMRQVDITILEKFLLDHRSTTSSIAFLPVADEKVAFSNYTQRAIDGYQAKLPAIIGGTAQDGVPFAPYNVSGVNTTVALYQNLLNFFCPQTQTIKNRQLAGLPTYRYHYSGNFSNISPRGWEGAYHCSELPIIMGTFDDYRGVGSDLENATSIAMQDAYLAFAARGTKGLAKENWQPYVKLGQPTVRGFGEGTPAKNIDLTYLEGLCVGYQPAFTI